MEGSARIPPFPHAHSEYHGCRGWEERGREGEDRRDTHTDRERKGGRVGGKERSRALRGGEVTGMAYVEGKGKGGMGERQGMHAGGREGEAAVREGKGKGGIV